MLVPLRVIRRWCALLLALAVFVPPDARSQVVGEYELKGAFIANFAKFIEWPADAFEGPASPLVVCVAGKGPSENGLDAVINGQQAGGHALRAERFSESSRCHILFVGESEQKRFGEILRSVGSHTVTIGDTPRFLEAGGAIAFRSEGNRLQFDINMDVVTRAQYRVSSKLLALARKADAPVSRPRS